MNDVSYLPLLLFCAGTLWVARGAPRWAFRRPALLLVLSLALGAWGLLAAARLPVALMPNISSETVTVTVNVRGGMAPSDVESQICLPLEDALGDLSRMENILSSARKDRGVVSLLLEPGTDMKRATGDVHARLERVMSRLPPEIEKPVVAHFEESDAPIFLAAFTSDRHSPEDLRRIVENKMKDRLQRIAGVANVEVGGGREGKILVEVDRDRLSAYRLTLHQIVRRLGRRNVSTQVGSLDSRDRTAAVHIVGTLSGLEDIKQLPVGRDPQGGTVLLGQVAQVADSYLEAESLSRLNGRPAVSLYIQKESSANTLQTAREVERTLNAAWAELPADLRRSIQKVVVSNQADTIQASLESVRTSLLSGVLLIVLVIASFQSPSRRSRNQGRVLLSLLLGGLVAASLFKLDTAVWEIPLWIFLAGMAALAFWDRDLRPAFVVGGSIPASALLSLILFHLCGVSLNVMSLFGLALGMGMLVDNAMVVYENIVRAREQTGPVSDPAAQAQAATEEMAVPLIGATVTNAVTFLPFLFLSKNLQLLYVDVAVAVAASLFSSVLVSLTVVPLLSLALLEPGPAPKRRLSLPPWLAFRRWIQAGERWRGRALFVLGSAKPYLTRAVHNGRRLIFPLAAGSALIFLACMLLGWKGPARVSFSLLTTVAAVVGTWSLASTHAMGEALFRHRGKVVAAALALSLAGGWILAKATDRDFETAGELDEFVIFVELSSGVKLDVASAVLREVENRLQADKPVARAIWTTVARIEGWSSRLYVTLRPRAERRLSTQQVIDRLRKKLDGVGRHLDENGFVHFSSPQTGREMTVQLQGPDYAALEQLAEEVTAGLEGTRGLADVKMRYRPGRPQVVVEVDPDRAARRGLAVEDVVETVHAQVRGLRATWLRGRANQTEVIVRLRGPDREKLETLVDLPLLTRRGERLRLGDVAALRMATMPNEIFRENKQRLIHVTANRERLSLSRAAEEIQNILDRVPFPRDYFGALSGDYQESVRGFRQLTWGLLAMAVTVYLVLVILFESLLQPLIIMATVPLSITGAAWGLSVLGLPLSTGVLVGLMMLGGIVVNNGIMLLDHMNRQPAGSQPDLWARLREAVLARQRAILLTAGSAVLGFLPLLLDTSETGALWRPLAAAMVFGLFISTILTVYIVPCLSHVLLGDVPSILHGRKRALFGPLSGKRPSHLLHIVHNFFFEN